MTSTTTAMPAGVTPIIVTETGAGGYQVEVRVGAHRFLADEPEAVGGLASGPNPMSCLAPRSAPAPC
jgi:putative redox protein